ncbi:DUF4189 domain-containing protein [Lysobacter enzymogenes]|uniref:DUF4189 domain-containing protein n=1 Tax=Lysobacter enzymogenes TaxID=69 RepID=UPI001AF2FF63|nr:DUF4189 domain-containing protein [Lysobacter enzymogenes]QQQ00871.1 DUF4189 domain-containing protein [Lysobacter enzymogenes]
MTPKLLFCALGALSLSFAGPARAEGDCPAGFFRYSNPGQPGHCVPMPATAERQPDRWQTRWGAIAIDPTASRGGAGFVVGEASKRAAERRALAKCKETGGGPTCAVTISFKNQCVATAWGSNYTRSMTAPTQDEATRLAMDDCRQHDQACEVFYEACSYPEQVR